MDISYKTKKNRYNKKNEIKTKNRAKKYGNRSFNIINTTIYVFICTGINVRIVLNQELGLFNFTRTLDLRNAFYHLINNTIE